MFGFEDIINVCIVAACLGGQYFLASRHQKYWGALLPAVFIVWKGTLRVRKW